MNEPVEFAASDGVTLHGELRRRGRYWAILVHDLDADLDSLDPLAGALADEDFSVLALDLRGHGLSDGEADDEGAVLDVVAAIDWARRAGAGQIFAVAAGAGAGAVLGGAAGGLIAAAVLLSPRPTPGCTTERVRLWAGPKLFLVGSGDRDGETVARALLDRCIGPRLLIQLPTEARGHGLLAGEIAAQALSHSVGYLAQNRSTIEEAA